MTSQILLSQLDAGILRLTLNDGARRNALSESMLRKLNSELDSAAKNSDVKLVIINAIGPAFSAGHDLKEITAAREEKDQGLSFFTNIMALCSGVMQSIVNNPKTIIAEIDGVATAAGCQLVASCDLAYASTNSRFATPGVNIGLFCSTPMVALSRNVSPKHAMEMLLTGDMVSADEAKNIGLINRVVEQSLLQTETAKISQKIMSKSGRVLSIGKGAFYRQSEMSLSSAYDLCSRVMVENMLDKEAQEGVSAFLEKRHPNWEA